MHACPRVFVSFLFPKIAYLVHKKVIFSKKTFLKSISIWLGPKSTLGFRIPTSLRNGGRSRKGYKMRCLQIPLFWFISSANGIKRIRDKTFCFDVWLGPNPHTQLMANNTHTWGGVQLCRVVWDSYVRSPTFVTWETSNDRFTILEPVLSIVSKRWVTHYPRVTKNEKQTWPTFATINQNKQGAFTSLKGYIYIWCPSGAFASNFSRWLVPLGNTCLLSLTLSLLSF